MEKNTDFSKKNIKNPFTNPEKGGIINIVRALMCDISVLSLRVTPF